MESNLADIMSGDDLCNYFDFVGNFDDRDLFLFVKTAEHLCTLNYHCRLPTDTATHYVTYSSAVKLLSKTGEPSPLSELPLVPAEYRYSKVEDMLKQEGKQIQFKLLASNKEQGKSFADRIRYYCVKYVSAFANHYGGHVYFGIEDATSAVYGEALEASAEYKITHQVQRMMKDMIWGDTGVHVQQGKHWDIKFHPVANCPRNERRRVVVVSVCKFPGGVFTCCPESYVVRPGGDVEQLSFNQWKAEVLSQSRVRPELHTRFVKVPLHTPFSRLVYTLPHTLQAAKERVLKLTKGFNFEPKHYLDTLDEAHLVTCIRRVMSTFGEEPHLAIPLQCWRTRLSAPTHDDLRSSLLILSKHYGVHLVLFVTSHLNSGEVWKVAQSIAREVKLRLVQHGGCLERLAVKIHLLCLADNLMLQNFQASLDSSIYPPTYLLHPAKMDSIATSLLLSIASYTPCQQPQPPSALSQVPHHHKKSASAHKQTSSSEKQSASTEKQSVSAEKQSLSEYHDCHFLLTCDQLELLWTRQFTKQLWVHGPPGAGKTVAAMEMIRELVDRGCGRSQILYLAENPLLCAYVNSFKVCHVVSRRELMEDSTKPRRFLARYKDVRNVIIDEAQNFKDRDGDWYSLAEKLANQDADTTIMDNQVPASEAVVSEAGVNAASLTNEIKDSGSGTSTCDNIPSSTASSKCDKSLEEIDSNLVSSPKKTRSSKVDLTCGYFWVFMDYAQKVHKFKAGLPGLIGKNNFMLSEISRNSKEIFDYAMKFMDKPSEAVPDGKTCVSDAPRLGHDYQNGKGVEVVKCTKESVYRTLFGVLESYLGTGMKPDDIAILVSKRREKDEVEKSVNETDGTDDTRPTTQGVTVDTVRGFSGMDKSVVIGLEPHANENHADLDKFIVNLATRAKDGLVIITTSDELMKKLQAQ
ncbi:hypothetical protein V1264_013826 [Littorina saxatilis]|uniref:Schlafen group 3-like DNA/RNA helicase domain-containing protein n=2 Tax=Littorina saxatilis TaxID=31220 RepID=A0AAN9BQL3_9CAEN